MDFIGEVESFNKKKLNKGGKVDCPTCKTNNPVRIPNDFVFTQDERGVTEYIGLYLKNCDHIMPLGLCDSSGETILFNIVGFDELHDKYMDEYEETGCLSKCRLAKHMLDIKNNKVEMEWFLMI